MGETASKLVDPHDKSIVMLYGDASAAILLEKTNEDISAATLLRSDGLRSITDVPKALNDYLESTGISPTDYDAFVFNQTNEFIIKQLIRKLKLKKDTVQISLDRYGNSTSDYYKEGKITPEMR